MLLRALQCSYTLHFRILRDIRLSVMGSHACLLRSWYWLLGFPPSQYSFTLCPIHLQLAFCHFIIHFYCLPEIHLCFSSVPFNWKCGQLITGHFTVILNFSIKWFFDVAVCNKWICKYMSGTFQAINSKQWWSHDVLHFHTHNQIDLLLLLGFSISQLVIQLHIELRAKV